MEEQSSWEEIFNGTIFLGDIYLEPDCITGPDLLVFPVLLLLGV